jgi:hypothetical protein
MMKFEVKYTHSSAGVGQNYYMTFEAKNEMDLHNQIMEREFENPNAFIYLSKKRIDEESAE